MITRLAQLAIKFNRYLVKIADTTDDDLADLDRLLKTNVDGGEKIPESDPRHWSQIQNQVDNDSEVKKLDQELQADLRAKYPQLSEKLNSGNKSPSNFTPDEQKIISEYEQKYYELKRNKQKHYQDIANQQHEFDQQDKSIQQFQQQEQRQKATQQQSIQGKTQFSQQDAAQLTNSIAQEIISIANKLKLPPNSQTMTVSFYNNGNVGFISTNQQLANATRQSLEEPLKLNLKQYLINNRKYFDLQQVAYTVRV